MDSIGDQLARMRNRAGLTQDQLAEIAGISVTVVRKLEHGGTARIESYHALARALGVRTMMFVPAGLDDTDGDPMINDERTLAVSALRDVLLPPVGFGGEIFRTIHADQPPDLTKLRGAVDTFGDEYEAGNYGALGRMAAGLLRSAHFHVESLGGEQSTRAKAMRADALNLMAMYLIQIREHDLAAVAARSALADAESAGEPDLAVSAIDWQLWVLQRHARLDTAEETAARVADQVEPSMRTATPDQLASWGRLLLRASGSAARNNRPEVAADYLEAAGAAARVLGRETNDLAGRYGFGPGTVASRGPENMMVAGRPDEALKLLDVSRGLDPSTSTGAWRKQLVRAEALGQLGRRDDALNTVVALMAKAPGWTTQQQYARTVMAALVGKGGRLTAAQRKVAEALHITI